MQSKCVGNTVVKYGLLGFALMALLFFVSGNAMAQVNTASLSGTVTDASGAAVPGATVTATSNETGSAHTATTNDTGFYQMLSLPVGKYDVKSEKDGFKTSVQTGVDLVVGQQGVINLAMQVGQVSQQVTVSGEAAMVVNTTTASIAGLVNEQQVKDLPLNGRSFDSLITLNAGAVNFTAMKNAGGSGTPLGNRFVVVGRRPSENYITVNGVELPGPDQDQTIPWGVSGELLGVDSIREYNVLQSAYGAEYGVKAGGQVSVVTQSGSNQWHGSLFEFLRNSIVDAQEFNNNNATGTATNNPIPPLRRNQFGASGGGPIIKDKLFIFANYEGLRWRLGETSSATVPDTCARQGLTTKIVASATTSYTCGNAIPGLDTAMLPYIKAYWPVPTGGESANLPAITDGSGGLDALGVAGFSGNPGNPLREDYGVLRGDYSMTSKDTLTGVYTVDDGFTQSPVTYNPIFTNNYGIQYKVLSLAETHTFSPNVINTFTAGISRVSYPFTPVAPGIPGNLSVVSGLAAGLITVGVGGGGAGTGSYVNNGGSSTGSNFKDYKTLFTYEDQVGVVRGKQQWSFGVWLQRQRDNGSGNSSDLGRANFFENNANALIPTGGGGAASYLDLFQGYVGTAGLVYVPNEITHQWREWMGAWFVQDQIQVKKNLTVRLGLRHEFTNGWNDPTGRASNWVAGANGILNTNVEVSNSAVVQNNAKLLFSPRVGIAWDVRGDGKTSVRASFGTYYDLQNDFTTIMLAAPPFNTAATLTGICMADDAAGDCVASHPGSPVETLPLPTGVQPTVPYCTGAASGRGSGMPTNPATPGTPGACNAFTPRGFDSNFKVPTVEEWELSVEHQLTSTMSLRVAYNGSEGFHQVVIADPNTIPPSVCSTPPCTAGGLNYKNGTPVTSTVTTAGTLYIPVSTYRPNPLLGAGTYFFRFYGTSAYNGILAEVKKQVGSGLNFKASYTYSHNLDEGSGEGLGEAADTTNIMTPYNPRYDRGPSAHDFTQLVSISGSYDLPFGKGKRFGADSGSVVNNIIGGWQVNAIVSMATGYPLIPTTGGNTSGNGDVTGPDRVSYAPGFTSIPTSGTSAGCKTPGGVTIPAGTPIGNATYWYDPCAVALPGSGTWGNVAVGALRAPGWANLDMSFFKNFSITERMKMQFRTEIFNLPNHPQLGNPIMSATSGKIANIAAASGQPFTFQAREIQFGLKLNF